MSRRHVDARTILFALGCAGALLPVPLFAQDEARSEAGARIEFESGLLWLPPGFARETQPYALQIHFHGGPKLALEGFAKSGRGPHEVLLALHRDGFSKVYEQWLADEGWLDTTLARVDVEVAKLAPRERAAQVSVSAFSAGYAAVRCLLRRDADRARIRTVELADGLHASYDESQRPLAEQIAPFVAFARDAAAGKTRFLLTHSAIVPPGYASVAECADALVEALGQQRMREELDEGDGLLRASRATQGGFEVLGYAGDQAADHVRHFRRLWRPRPAVVPPLTIDEALAANAALVARCTRLARRHAHAWLAHADPKSGLLPRTLRGDAYWNARDCAADNLPFLALTGEILGDVHLRRAALFLLAQEQKLTSRVGALPDDFDFATQRFRRKEPVRAELVFGAAEYAKDGLAPWFEWTGPGPWLDRMQALVRGVWDGVETGLPSDDVEVFGDLLQVCARLHWWTGDERYAQWTLRLADEFLVGQRDLLLQGKQIALRDHGCEVIGGLAEAYVLAAHRDPARRERYRPWLYALLDRILEAGRDERGLLFDAFDPRSGARVGTGWSDGYGYVYDAFLCVAELDGVARYREAVAHVLAHLEDVRCATTPGFGGADGHADAIESALNLLARVPEPRAEAWIEREMGELCALQREDGVIEGWYGDGNSARTALMVALWKTLGVAPEPWPEDLSCAAVRAEDGTLILELRSPWAWRGVLRFDRPRHRDVQHLPFDLARINQFPEWFTAERHLRYAVRGLDDGGAERELSGAALWRLPLALKPGETRRIHVRALDRAPLRAAAYRSSDAASARAWQESLREEMRALLRLPKRASAFDEKQLRTEIVIGGSGLPDAHDLPRGSYELRELELQSTPTRRMKVLLTTPQDRLGPFPAVVCIHGHGGTRRSPYDASTVYRGFADALAREGFATIAVDVGQHEIYEAGGTLLGERLHDLVRCVDYLAQQENVDARRIGCAGLSLGGEMAMWLGALDERIVATVSCGFLTTMDQLEQGHCLCWKLEGLRERVDFADLYALAAPRALQCQNGLAEPPQDFCVPLAREALAEIARTYADLGERERCELHVHDGGHVVDVEATLAFLRRNLSGDGRSSR